MTKSPQVSRLLGPAIVVALFIGALWLLHHELKYYHLRDIQRSLAEIPAHRVWLVVALTVVNYLILIGYDLLAVRSIHHPLPLRRIALASFTGFVTSYNFGALLGGTSVRYRLYSAWGLSAVDILRLVFMLGVTFWFGVTALAGLLLFLDPFPLPASLAVLGTGVRPLGAILLFVTAAYLYLTIRLSRPIHIRGVELRLPGPGISALQIVVAAADLAVAAAALYVLLPEGFGKGFFEFLGMYLLAVVVVIFSHVPGGVGVFELMVLKLAGAEANESVVAALLVFRGVYYLLPLLAASLLLAGRELLEHRAGFQRLLGASGRAVSVVAPSLVACATFASGAILLLSGAIPPPRGRLALLEPFVPLPLVEISHFLGSVTGAALLVLAHGLQRRLDAAWWFATGLLSAAIVFSLLAGWHYEVAVALAVVLVMLAVSRRRFYRKSSLLHPGLTPGWITAIVMVVLCSIWLGLFTYRHVDYSADLWWKFAFHGHAPRFLRAMAGVVAFLLILALNRLLTRPAAPSERPTVLDLEAAARIVSVSPRAEANLALLGDKSLLFNGDRTAFVMYSVRGRSWIAFGDPIGAEPDREELAWQFRELVDRYDGWSVFYQVCETNLAVYLDLGLTLLQLGEEGRVPLEQFSLEGSARAGLRYTHHRFQRDGWTFDVVAHDAMSAILRDVKAISDAWLAEKASREQGFSLGFFNEAYLRHFPCAVVRYAGKLIAFANIWQGAEREELSIDLMRYRPGAPSGVMEFLFVELMLWGKAQGYRWFSLGMAPLSGIEDGPLAPLWNKVVGLAFRHGEHFDSGLGLREYKQKFDPVWTPRYLASPGGLVLPQILADIAVLINRPGESTVNAKVAVPAREEP